MPVSEAQDEAKEALFKAIQAVAKDAPDYGAAAAPMLRDAAYAWRALVGGSQPGGVNVQQN